MTHLIPWIRPDHLHLQTHKKKAKTRTKMWLICVMFFVFFFKCCLTLVLLSPQVSKKRISVSEQRQLRMVTAMRTAG